MAIILNLETSTKNCSVSISKNGKLLCLCEESKDNYQHAEKLHIFIQWALEGAEITIKDIEAVAVNKGPGSYTGLRIGVSAAKGICFALGIPLIGIDSMQILAHSYQGNADYIIPMIDARRKEVYTATFSNKKELLTPIHAKILDKNSYLDLKTNSIAIIGDGSNKAKEILQLPNVEYIKSYPSAREIGKLAEYKFNHKEWVDTAYFEPFYLKDFVAGK